MRKDTMRIALPSDMVRAIDYIIKRLLPFGYTSRPEFIKSIFRRHLQKRIKNKEISPREMMMSESITENMRDNNE